MPFSFTVMGLPWRSTDLPATTRTQPLADAILFDIVALDAVEADADAALEQFLVEERALRVVAQAIRRRVDDALQLHGHGITMAIDGLAGDDAHPAPR